MKRTLRKTRKNRITSEHRVVVGAAPGALRIDPESAKPEMRALCYGPEAFTETGIQELEEIPGLLNKHTVTWIHVAGLGSEAVLEGLQELFKIHRLALEDVVNEHQRPKVEEYEHHMYAALQALDAEGSLPTEQVNIFWGDRWVLTFQQRLAKRFDGVRDRIRRGKSKIRERGPDYLAYALIDALVDGFFPIVDRHVDELTTLEEEILQQEGHDIVSRLSTHKHDLVALRRAVAPLREAINGLIRSESEFLEERTLPYLRDALDHAMQLSDLVDAARELVNGLLNVHLSMVSFRTNEVMRVLTIIATIFIPLTFLAGIWGMNFQGDKAPYNMPELRWAYGYPAALLLMFVTSLALVYYFWRKGWLGRQPG